MDPSDRHATHGQGYRGRRALSVFLALTCLRVWLGPIPVLEEARAQIPDSGLQRKLMLDEAKRANQLLADIKQILEQGTLHVRVQGADNQKKP